MLATNNTPKVQAPCDVSLLHPLLIIQGYYQNYTKDKDKLNTIHSIHLGNIYLIYIVQTSP